MAQEASPEPKASALRDSIEAQRRDLKASIAGPLQALAAELAGIWGDRARMDAVLEAGLARLPYARYLYATDTTGRQITDNVSRSGRIEADYGRDRSSRPYLREAVPADGFLLSRTYISLRDRRPALTAIQIVRDPEGHALGFAGADFFLQDLPLTRPLYEEPRQWRQIKGDPSIRGTVFQQTRTESEMDRHIDTVLGVMEALMVDHGVFHVILHFSSSRAVIWVVDDPYRYRLLDISALTDADVCLAYPRRPYPPNALVPAHAVRPVLDQLRQLRFMDEMFYLRSGTLNVFNGVVGLTFSCDGSHYIPWDEFLRMDMGFWLGTLGAA